MFHWTVVTKSMNCSTRRRRSMRSVWSNSNLLLGKLLVTFEGKNLRHTEGLTWNELNYKNLTEKKFDGVDMKFRWAVNSISILHRNTIRNSGVFVFIFSIIFWRSDFFSTRIFTSEHSVFIINTFVLSLYYNIALQCYNIFILTLTLVILFSLPGSFLTTLNFRSTDENAPTFAKMWRNIVSFTVTRSHRCCCIAAFALFYFICASSPFLP